ncbi:MAG: tRNA (cytosine(32)/uridine(32)-2'-O)-methyltransferase TrmJ [Gammaproteobacteria bacterium]|nr:tRNA (cytosine(32)/uridine(32)-2'-O)-methyltransferase TrmJ [Gammaproteobacteria bacterium]
MNSFPHVRLVLIETTHPGNIGAAARAMKNMGLNALYLVNPHTFPHEKAVWRAASAADLVDSAVVCETVEEAITGCRLVIGTSARERRIPLPLIDPRACGERVVKEAAPDHPVAILFGRESRGLKNEELQLCHFHVNIPTSEAYSSLNLAMAVQVIAYEILCAGQALDTGQLVGEGEKADVWDMPLATTEEMAYFYEHLEQSLIGLGFHDPANPRQLMVRLRRLFNRIRPDQMEVSILRGMLSAIDQVLAEEDK